MCAERPLELCKLSTEFDDESKPATYLKSECDKKKIIYDVTVNMQHVYFVKGVQFGGRKGTTV